MADHLPENIRHIMNKLKDGAVGKDVALLDALDVSLASMVPADNGDGVMRVESMVSSKDKNPVITFIWGTMKGELDPITARGYALQILETCEAAVQDASLYRAIVDSGGTDQHAFTMINLIRENRRKFEQQ